MNELIHLRYSPWSERARWTLDHHKIPYRKTEHLPMVGELALRFKTKNFTGKTCVPVLISKDGIFQDSLKIAHYAESQGKGKPLFPSTKTTDIEQWHQLSESMLFAGRALVSARVLEHKEAQQMYLPPFIPKTLRPYLTSVTMAGVYFIAYKYGVSLDNQDSFHQTQRECLLKLRQGLGGRDYLLDEFSFADITSAVMLQMIQPVDAEFIPLVGVARECWINQELKDEFKDLIDWRDALYRKHRKH